MTTAERTDPAPANALPSSLRVGRVIHALLGADTQHAFAALDRPGIKVHHQTAPDDVDIDILILPMATANAIAHSRQRIATLPDRVRARVADGSIGVVLDSSNKATPHGAGVEAIRDELLAALGASPRQAVYLTADRFYEREYLADCARRGVADPIPVVLHDFWILSFTNHLRLLDQIMAAVTRIHRGDEILAQGKHDDPVVGLKDALSRNPFDVDALRDLARIRTQRAELEAAAEVWERLSAIRPEDPEAALAIGRRLYDRGLRAQAAPYLAIAAAHAPHKVGLWRKLAWARRGQADAAGEIEALSRAIALAPDDAEDQQRLVDLLVGMGRLAEAEPLISRRVPLEPNNLILRGHLAKARSASGDRSGAVEAWREVLAVHPTHPEANLAIGETLAAAGLHAEAASHLAIAAPAAARPEKVWIQVLRHCKAAGDAPGAVIALHNIIDNSADFPADHHRHLVELLESLDRWGDTKGSLVLLLRHDPKNLSLLQQLANAYRARGDLQREIRTWRKLIGIDPGHALAEARISELEDYLAATCIQ